MAHLRDLNRLLELARLARSEDLDEVLAAVAQCVAGVLGYRAVVVNLRRPAWDDLEVVHVVADDDSVDLLLGSTNSFESWQGLMQPRYERRGAYFLRAGEAERAGEIDEYIPDLEVPEDPTAWHPEDMLLVPLTDAEGELLGVLSVDEPLSGRRPDDDELETLVAVCSHAAVALTNARASVEAARLRGALDDLLRVSHRVHDERPLEEALDDVCIAVQQGLGFEKVVVLLPGADGDRLEPRALAGFDDDVAEAMRSLSLTGLTPVFDARFAREGCQLLEDRVARALVSNDQTIYSSENNGRGPRAWTGHWLFAPLHDAEGRVAGLLWADDPEDRLLPDPDRLRALRLFADQAAAALAATARLAHLRHLADVDPLTGVHNRRALTERLTDALERGGPVSLVFVDLDHFKRINDDHGHDAGDAALRRFGAVLQAVAAEQGGHAVRLGGEEFCLALPACDGGQALLVAEALRLRSSSQAGVALSAGIATSAAAVPDAQALLRAADQALYAAKRLGRDRCVTYDPALPAVDRRAPAVDTDAQSLSAVLLLAGALDLRDASTATHSRTVARYAELTGTALGLDRARVERLRIAGALHDIGKIAVSDAVLGKDGPLTDEEWREIRRHPEVGAQILEHAGLDDIAAWVLRHHERMDGRGYPGGLPGEGLPLEARVLCVVDAYEAMTADRPYRAAMPAEEALTELRRCAGSQFDGAVVEAFAGALLGAPALAA